LGAHARGQFLKGKLQQRLFETDGKAGVHYDKIQLTKLLDGPVDHVLGSTRGQNVLDVEFGAAGATVS
jgi:hypothetical protein